MGSISWRTFRVWLSTRLSLNIVLEEFWLNRDTIGMGFPVEWVKLL